MRGAALARADASAEATKVMRGLVAVPAGLAGREIAPRPGQEPNGLLRIACLRQRDARDHSAASGRYRRMHCVRSFGGPERLLCGLGRVAIGERKQRASVQHPCLGERQSQAASRRLATREPFRGGDAVAAVELGTGQDGVEPTAPPGLDQRQIGKAGRAELLDTPLGLPDLKPDHADMGVRRRGEDAVVE